MAETSWPAAEETDAGEADSTTKVAPLRGLCSAGVAALLSAHRIVFCCVHQFLFPCLDVLVQGTSAPRVVSCQVLLGCCIDVTSIHVAHADNLVFQPWAASGFHSCCQRVIDDVFWDAAIVHAVDMTQPALYVLPQQSVHPVNASTGQDLVCVHGGYFSVERR